MANLVDQQTVTLVRVGVLDHDLDYPAFSIAIPVYPSSPGPRADTPTVVMVPAWEILVLDFKKVLSDVH
jgi:hypothetical protein